MVRFKGRRRSFRSRRRERFKKSKRESFQTEREKNFYLWLFWKNPEGPK